MAEHNDSDRTTTQFAVVPEWVIYGASANAVKVYAILDRHSNKAGEAFPSLKRLSALLDASVDTARRGIRELEAIGALIRDTRERPDGGTSSNLYCLAREPFLLSPPSTDDGGPLAGVPGARRTRVIERDDVTTNGVVTSEAAPAVMLVSGRNLPHDALADVCQIAAKSPRHREVAVALNGSKRPKRDGIRDFCWRDHPDVTDPVAFEWLIADAIRERATLYRAVFEDATLTPLALAKWWVDLPLMSEKANRGGLTPEQIASGAWRHA